MSDNDEEWTTVGPGGLVPGDEGGGGGGDEDSAGHARLLASLGSLCFVQFGGRRSATS